MLEHESYIKFRFAKDLSIFGEESFRYNNIQLIVKIYQYFTQYENLRNDNQNEVSAFWLK
jgi:hypothetical protein